MLSTMQSKKGMVSFKKDELLVKIIPDREEMGKVAANEVTAKIIELLDARDEINMIFAAAPSQNEFIADLISRPEIDWTRINAFHMDEYIGLDPEAPQAFGKFLKIRIFGKVPLKNVFYPVDIVCLGIGENGHIAFNDPGVADFNDDKLVKVADLDMMCRQQQVNDKCFDEISDVPTQALTLTIPALLRGKYLYCIVPAINKAKAVYNTLNGEITEDCPATILRTKENVTLYLDGASSALLDIK